MLRPAKCDISESLKVAINFGIPPTILAVQASLRFFLPTVTILRVKLGNMGEFYQHASQTDCFDILGTGATHRDHELVLDFSTNPRSRTSVFVLVTAAIENHAVC